MNAKTRTFLTLSVRDHIAYVAEGAKVGEELVMSILSYADDASEARRRIEVLLAKDRGTLGTWKAQKCNARIAARIAVLETALATIKPEADAAELAKCNRIAHLSSEATAEEQALELGRDRDHGIDC